MNALLKVTTDYSLLKSMIKIPELMEFCKKNNITTCGICDNNLFGATHFYNSCISNHIKPLIGLEISVNYQSIYLYAKNYSGYQNLLKLNTIIQTRMVSTLDLEMYCTNVIAVIPYHNIDSYKEISKIYKTTFISYSNAFEKKNALLITKDILYLKDIKALNEKDASYLNYLQMIELNKTVKDFALIDYTNNVVENLPLDNENGVGVFISMIDLVFPKNTRYIPKYECDMDSYTYLKNLAHKGLKKRLQNKENQIYQDRLEYELSVIKKMGFVDYFLIVYDYVLFAKKNKILVGAGRGSAVGSLVCYCLGITDVNPIKYNLLFERFLNPERITMPDIDIDFENTKREMVVNYVKEKYGKDCVAGIMTYGTLKSRLVLRLVLKCLDIDNSKVDKFITNIDSRLTLKENLEKESVKDFIKNDSEIKKAYQISMKLENLKRNISTHAAGIVISSETLENIIPVCINDNELFTGVTMEYLEDLGLLKMDFLALKNLTTIANVLDLIEKQTSKRLNLNAIDLNDPKVLSLFHDANTIGIFQFESTGMTNFLQKLKPSSFEDLTAALALFRPGPMENIDSFIRRKYKREKIEYLHKDLEDILKETYGIIVYQEQIMQILVKIAGYSYAEADNIRRAMSKKKKEIIDKEESVFITRAIKKGYAKDLAEKIYALILKFANYGFNKSHSVSYAFIGYQMAYLKVYFPGYFFANLLNNVIGVENKTKEYIDEAKRLHFSILPPDINLSYEMYNIEKTGLRMPFGVIKNIGSSTVSSILLEREKQPFKSFIDFVKRTYGKGVNSKAILSLIHGSVFESFHLNKKTLEKNLDIIMNYASLAADLEEEFLEKPEIVFYEDYTKEEQREIELNSYGFYISNHPASKYTDKSITKIENIGKNYNKMAKCVVLVDQIKIIKTKNNEDMAFVDASDETGTLTFVLFANSMEKIKLLEKNKLVLLEGKIAKRFDKYQINITNVLNIK